VKGDCAGIVLPENISLRPEGGFIYFSLFSKINTLKRSQRKIKYLLTVVLFKVTRTKVYKKKYGRVCTRPFFVLFRFMTPPHCSFHDMVTGVACVTEETELCLRNSDEILVLDSQLCTRI